MYKYITLFILLIASTAIYASEDCTSLTELQCHLNSTCIPVNYKMCCGEQKFGCYDASQQNSCEYKVDCYRSSKSLDVIEASNECFVPPVGFEKFVPLDGCSEVTTKDCLSQNKTCVFKRNTCSNPTSCCLGTEVCEGGDQSDTPIHPDTRSTLSENNDQCQNVICQQGQHCEIDAPSGLAYCAQDGLTIGGSGSTGNACTGVICQVNQHCEVTSNGQAHCVANINPIGFTTTGASTNGLTIGGTGSTTGGGVSSCSQVTCPRGYHCEFDGRFYNCIADGHTTTTTTTGGVSSCSQVHCPRGYHCVFIQATDIYKCVADKPSTTGGTGSTTGDACTNVICQINQHCEVTPSGQAHCVANINPIGFTTGGSTNGLTIGGTGSTTGDACTNVICQVNQHCEITPSGQAYCVANISPSGGSTSADPCTGVLCLVGQHCENQNGVARCVQNLTPL